MITMKTQVDTILKCLIYLPMWGIGRRPVMEWFVFGNDRRIVTTKDGSSKIVSEYSLHIQCAWRFRGTEGVLIGSHYRYLHAENPFMREMIVGRNRPLSPTFEERVDTFFLERNEKKLLVCEIIADEVGGFQLGFTDGYYLEVFPDGSVNTEDWRLFQPYTDNDHYISDGHQIIIG